MTRSICRADAGAGCLVAAVVAVASVVGLFPDRVEACSCAAPSLDRRAVPADGAEEFPIDGSIRVFLQGGYSDALQKALGEAYRLRDDDGNRVELSAETTLNRLDLEPDGPLQPGTDYTLERVYSYDGRGARVSDDRRWRWAVKRAKPSEDRRTYRRGRGAPETVRLAWFPVVSFRNGSGDPKRSVEPPEVRTAEWAFAYGGGDCGPAVGLSVDFDPPAGLRASDVVELEVEGRGVVATRPAKRAGSVVDSIGASDFLCNPDPVYLEYEGDRRARLRIVDPGGRVLARGGWFEAKGSPSRRLGARWKSRREKKRMHSRPGEHVEKAAEKWLDAPMVEGDVRRMVGPNGCRFGFRSDWTVDVSGPDGTADHDSFASISWSRDRGWVAYRPKEAEHIELAAVRDGALPVRRAIEGVPNAETMDAGDDAVYIVSLDYSRDRTASTLHAVSFGGERRWRDEFGPGMEGHAVLADGDRVLVAWPRMKDHLNNQLAWAIYDTQNGERLVRNVTSRDIVNNSVRAARLEEGYAIAYIEKVSDEQRVALSVVEGDEEVHHRVLDVGTRNYMDMEVHGSMMAVATRASRKAIQWSLYNTRGRRVAPSAIVNRGIDAAKAWEPRVQWIQTGAVASEPHTIIGGSTRPEAPFDRLLEPADGFFAVGWETDERVFAAAVGLYGNVSRATPRHDGAEMYEPELVDAGGRVATSYVGPHYRDYPIFAEMLRCRDSAPSGAPQRIQPLR